VSSADTTSISDRSRESSDLDCRDSGARNDDGLGVRV